MSFVGLHRELAPKIKSWGLPKRILDGFLERIEEQYRGKEASAVPTSVIGMNTNIIIQDPDDEDVRFVFFVRFHRNDMDFWISSCECSGLRGNKPFWTSGY